MARHTENDAEWLGHCLRELGELDLAEGWMEQGWQKLVRAREYFLIAGARTSAPQLLRKLEAQLVRLSPNR